MSPIIIFAFNRLNSLITTIESIKQNPESSESELYIYVDGPRPNKIDEKYKVLQVQEYVKTITGFKSVQYEFSNENKGLAPSIIDGVTKIINQHGRVIVIEDDLYVSRSFLKFMNQMLSEFEKDNRVFQISGYSPKITQKIEGDIYLYGRAQSWSWATWKNRWSTIDWDVKDYYLLCSNRRLRKNFNSHGSDLTGMLKSYMAGKISSWYIRFCYSMHKQNKYTICPSKSLVRNDGFNNDATHCKSYNRYKITFEYTHNGEFIIPPNITPDQKILKEAIKFWTIKYRIYGKIMTYIHKLINFNK